MAGRIPPNSIPAEKALLGSVLTSREAFYDIGIRLTPEDFYEQSHRAIYRSMQSLASRSRPIDIITVTEELDRTGDLKLAGGRAYLEALSEDKYVSASNIGEYAMIVADRAKARRLIRAGEDIVQKGYSNELPAEKLADMAEGSIFDISEEETGSGTEDLQQVLLRNVSQIEEAEKHKGKMTGVPSGFIELDKMTSGFQKSDLIILAARPSMGKTAFALSAAVGAAKKGNKVLLISMEMSKDQLGQRIISMQSGVDLHKIRTGTLELEEWKDISDSLSGVSSMKIYIDDTPALSALRLKSICRKTKATRGLDLVIVDYLQLMETDRAESRTQEISKLSRNLKLVAKELDCPIIVLSQLSRAPEQRADHRPLLSDLRESGSIEQDADLVMFLYRDSYYSPAEEEGEEAELIIAKQRNGPTGTVDLLWQKRSARFVNAAPKHDPALAHATPESVGDEEEKEEQS